MRSRAWATVTEKDGRRGDEEESTGTSSRWLWDLRKWTELDVSRLLVSATSQMVASSPADQASELGGTASVGQGWVGAGIDISGRRQPTTQAERHSEKHMPQTLGTGQA